MALSCASCHPTLVTVGEVLLSALIVFPLTLLYWSCTWKFLEDHLQAPNPQSGTILSMLIGAFMIICSYYILPFLRRAVVSENNQIDFMKHVFVSVTFNYWTVLGNIFLWFGVWLTTERIAGTGQKASLIVLCISLICLLLLRSTGNAGNSPFVIGVDYQPKFYHRKPRFRRNPQQWILHSFDVFFSVAVIQPLVVMLWAGTWNTIISFNFSPDKKTAIVICMGVGAGLYVLVFALEKPLRFIAGKLYEKHKYLEFTFASFFRIFVIFSALMIWVGFWGYLKIFVLTSDFVRKYPWFLIFGHSVGFSVLAMLGVSSTLGAIGIAVDSEHGMDGCSVDLSMNYFHHMCSQTQPELTSIQHVQANTDFDQQEDQDDPLLKA